MSVSPGQQSGPSLAHSTMVGVGGGIGSREPPLSSPQLMASGTDVGRERHFLPALVNTWTTQNGQFGGGGSQGKWQTGEDREVRVITMHDVGFPNNQ